MTAPLDNSKWYIRRVPLNNGGYDTNGYYWGIDLPLYVCYNDYEVVHFRADDREHAIEQLEDNFKGHEIFIARRNIR